MKNEELRQKYRLLKLVAEREVRTYHALDSAGHIVMVHYLPGDSPECERLLAQLDALIPADKMRIVERAEVDGAPVVVTQFIQGFETLSAWLQMRATQRQRAAAPPPPPARAPGQFTQLFGAVTTDRPPPPPESGTEAEPPHPPAASAAAPEQGDLTGVFGVASVTPPPATPPSPPSDAESAASHPARPPAEPPPSTKPSVRWREQLPEPERPLVHWKPGVSREAPPAAPPAPAVPPPPPPHPAPAAAVARPKAPGEMTQLFGPAGGVPTTPGTPSPVPRREAPPGEFTDLFHSEDRKLDVSLSSPSEQGPRDYLQALNLPAAPRDAPTPFHPSPPIVPAVPAPAAAKEPGDFTRLMAGIPAPPGPPQAGSPRGPVGVTGAPAGPSDFTGIVAGLPAPPSQPSPPQEQAEEAPQRRSPRLFVLLLALGIIGAAAVLVVVYFALKP